VNYGTNVGSVRPDLISWGRERDRGRSHATHVGERPRFLTEKDGGPDLGGFWGRGEIGAVLSMGIESGPNFTPLPISTT